MKYIDKLLQGAEVEWKPLGEVADIYGGLTGKSKSDFEHGNALFVSYKNIYNNYEVNSQELSKVKVSETEQQHKIEYGDILFTGSSETAEEVAYSSAVTTHFNEAVYLNSFSFGVRFHKDIELIPEFSKHLFRGSYMRKQLAKTASGVTRFNVSKTRFKKILIPIPPLSVQRKLVEILDKFTELEAELDCRKRQYEYYRNKLLAFDMLNTPPEKLNNVTVIPLEKLCSVLRGKRLTKRELYDKGDYPVFHGGIDPIGYYSKPNREAHSTMIINVGASAGTVGYSSREFWSSDGCFCFSHNESLNQRYLYYVLQCMEGSIKAKVRKAGIPTLDNKVIAKIKIPIPPLSEQQRIVSILDKFDTLTSSISEGLPKEIELRRKQYEYYREQLLSFRH